ncbi:tRNA-specific adenosine deaminase 2 [Euwallacea similis]|uniref:tRNA-specific adenosine deaminase 2 n=1 Tax=Euwallacea similis TaxID=1736056 RepID=UPI00344C4FC5
MNTSNSSVINLSEQEQFFMEKAFDFARQALANKEVPVGCIFVYQNTVLAVGCNEVNETKNATRHAEIICIDQVVTYCKDHNLSFKEVFQEIDVYVTVEPCIMCAAALYQLDIRSVAFGCRNDRFGGSTVFDVSKILKPQTKVKGGYKADKAMELLKEFYKGQNPNAPPSKINVKNTC